ATRAFLRYPKVARWLDRYPPSPATDATFKGGQWTVDVFSGSAGEIATGTVDDPTLSVVEAWTGPPGARRVGRRSPRPVRGPPPHGPRRLPRAPRPLRAGAWRGAPAPPPPDPPPRRAVVFPLPVLFLHPRPFLPRVVARPPATRVDPRSLPLDRTTRPSASR